MLKGFDHADDVGHVSKLFRNACRHCWRNARRPTDTREIVMHEVDGERVAIVLHLNGFGSLPVILMNGDPSRFPRWRLVPNRGLAKDATETGLLRSRDNGRASVRRISRSLQRDAPI